MSFPNRVNLDWPIGFPGEWASENPRRIVISGPNGYRAAKESLTIAAFAWVQDDGVTVANHPPSSDPTKPSTGFVYRAQQGLMTHYLEESTLTIPSGFMVTLAEGGDVFALSANNATRGDAVYASISDGSIQTAPNGKQPENTVPTGWIVSLGGNAGTPIIITGPLTPYTTQTTSK